jgi:hypothetical protein
VREAEGGLCRPSSERRSLATLSHVRRWRSQRLKTAVFCSSRGFVCRIEATARSPSGRGKQFGDVRLEEVPNYDYQGCRTTWTKFFQTCTI